MKLEGALSGRIVRGHVDLDQLQIVGLGNDVMRYTGRLTQAGSGRDGDRVDDAVEPEFNPPFQDVHEMRCHVVPMPARLLGEGFDGADMLGPDAATRRLRHAEVAILDVGPRTLAVKTTVIQGRAYQLRLCL